MKQLLAALVMLSACSNLGDLETGVCGNGVVERGEDCDSSDERCVACGIRCDDETPCDSYAGGGTEGCVCGADEFCHAPAGTFRDPDELTAAVESLRVTDIDADGIGDLLVQSPTALQVMFGNPEGNPTTQTSILTPIARGPASFAYLDGDQTLDLLVPTADGIVAYTSPFGVATPYPFPSVIAADMGMPRYACEIEPAVVGFIGLREGALKLVVMDVGPTGPIKPLAISDVCGAEIDQFAGGRVDALDAGPGLDLIAITLSPGGGMPARLCVLAIEKQGEGAYAVTSLAASTGMLRPVLRRPLLVPLRGACPSLLVRTVNAMGTPGGVLELVGQVGTAPAPCGFGAPQLVTSLPATTTPVGWLPLDPPLAGADRAVVTSSGVHAFTQANGFAPIHLADRPISDVRFVDLDGDSDIDLVASARDVEDGTAVDDLDIMYRAPNGMPDGFVRYRFDTNGPVVDMMLGDFDGNGVPDVAYVQKRIRNDVTSDELAIAYGTRDQLLPGAVVGTFPDVISVMPADQPDSNDPTNLVSDLAVLYGGATATSVTLLHGSPQRTMIGFFEPREPPNPSNMFRTSVFRGVVAGDFTSAGLAGLDLVAFDDVLAPDPHTELWLSNGPTGGTVEKLTPSSATDIVRCEEDPTTGPFCLDDARFVAWSKGVDDRVIGIDGFGRGMTLDPSASMGEPPVTGIVPWDATTLGVPEGARVRSLDVVSLSDGDRVIVSFTSPGAVAICEVAASGLPVACTDLGQEIGALRSDPTLTCSDATAARVSAVARFSPPASIGADLIALCRGTGGTALYRVRLAGGTIEATELRPADGAVELRAGDINGDGIEDLITIDRGSAIPTVRIYRQCTSRDRVGCVGPGSP